ncbi:unnamed protein product [Heterotrigona itama]|uniref:Uncharacterized protein n=1 Tax=Heterotrigona itama TaxID=395501 RepID=A0A6V7GVS2_9HYME|nr:unnamed protein product [Heterotrigona itama]
MKRITTEAENTARHMLTFMPRLIYCVEFPPVLFCVGASFGIFSGGWLTSTRDLECGTVLELEFSAERNSEILVTRILYNFPLYSIEEKR